MLYRVYLREEVILRGRVGGGRYKGWDGGTVDGVAPAWMLGRTRLAPCTCLRSAHEHVCVCVHVSGSVVKKEESIRDALIH